MQIAAGTPRCQYENSKLPGEKGGGERGAVSPSRREERSMKREEASKGR